ncbi:MAG: tetratricopeptide repeat protein [Verrucomicrobiota bacterium]
MRRFLIIVAIAGATACSRSPSKSFETGLAYFKDDDFVRAAVCFEQALKTGIPTAQVWNFLGASRLQNGDIETAIAAFQEALKLDANHNAARYNLATAYLEAKQPAQAIPLLRQLAQSANCPPSVNLQLGRAYIQTGDWLKAKPAFEKLSDQNTAEIQNNLGVIETHLGNTKLAKTHLEAAARLDLQHATARQNLAIFEQYYLAPKPVTPAKPAEQIVAPAKLPEPPPLSAAPLQVLPVVETPKPVVVTPPPATPKPVIVPRRVPVTTATLKAGDRAAAKTFFNDGIAQQQQAKLPAAIAAYTKAVATDPTFAQAYYNLGIAYRDSNQPDKALDNYELALAAQPDFRDARFNYAILLQQQGVIVDALVQYEKILELNPNEPAVRLTAATLYAHDPATRAKARQHYDAYLRLVPNSPMARDIRDWLEKNR